MIDKQDKASIVLGNAQLAGEDMEGANLWDANLWGADLRYANLNGANLMGTILDPSAPMPQIDDEDIISSGLIIEGEYVVGWRTKTSMCVGSCVYVPGHSYKADVFSVDTKTDCHPGIYLAGKAWLKSNYPGVGIVRVRCKRSDLLHAGDKWRCKQLEVIDYDKHND